MTAGLGLVYLTYRASNAVVDALPGALYAVNPTNSNNVFNQGATSAYQAVTGSTGSIGGDLYDSTHGGAMDGLFDLDSKNNIINWLTPSGLLTRGANQIISYFD